MRPRPDRGPRKPSGSKNSSARGAGRRTREASPSFQIVERPALTGEPPGFSGPFRVLIAVHRPRFRGRAERAAALVGWEVTALLNKQDPVGYCQKPPRPPDVLLLSGDFGRQKDYAIFRAVQRFRAQGMQLIGLVEDCQSPPEGFPDSVPDRLCDVCLTPPYRTADLRAVLVQIYERMRGEPAPPPITKTSTNLEDESDAEI
ncbi:MAG: hypothetical protein RMJ43_04115 [Chloroherpetonaceae bacterium]|nr:hypothetical protein [Chthonomonadaceae bacterium]MDW8206997.1 hypothetical protein [Chloroherpetonaceae bacterium]